MDSGRFMVKILDAPKSILRDVYSNETSDGQSPARMASGSGLHRHRVGVSPVRVKRSINDGVPTAVVTPSPPVSISTRAISGPLQAISAKVGDDLGQAQARYVSLNGLQHGYTASPIQCAVSNSSFGSSVFGSGSPLSRRSRSSAGATGLGLVPQKLSYDEFEEGIRKPLQHQQRLQRATWAGDGIDAECQVPSNSILTLHSLDESQPVFPQPRDDSQERRLKQLETRLREIEMRMVNGSANRRDVVSESMISSIADGLAKAGTSDVVRPVTAREPRRASTPTKGNGNMGILSVAVPPMMALDGGIYRVQPTPRSEVKAQREIERLEKKLKHQEGLAESLRAQHFKQIEQLTRQLAANDDMTQTLRSRIRELEVENELWQNRFRLYNDVDVAKILRENERLRAHQRRSSRSSRGEDEGKNELLRKKEQMEEENEKLRTRCQELEQKYRATKEKYKEATKAYRTQRRQDHIEVESLKVTIELQNAELAELRERWDQVGITAEEPPLSVINATPTQNAAINSEFVNYNLEKCHGIVDCFSKICTRLQLKQQVDVDDVLDYGNTGAKQKPKEQSDDKPLEERIESLASKIAKVHSQVVDLYAEDLANSITCNVQ